jgi:hypothetical protein
MMEIDVHIDDFVPDDSGHVWQAHGSVHRAGCFIGWAAQVQYTRYSTSIETTLEPARDSTHWLIVTGDEPAHIRYCIEEALNQQLMRIKQWRSSVTFLTHQGQPINTWHDWPHEDGKWKAGRSAMELAKHWTGPQAVPTDVEALLALEFGTLHLTEGEPEKATRLPPKKSVGPRMHDLWLKGLLPDKRGITVCVEAKADESFGETVAKYETTATATLKNTPNSKSKIRLQLLKKMIWGDQIPANVDTLRYQLLSALTGTAIQTLEDKSDVGVLLVHVFETDQTLSSKRAENDSDLTHFLSTLTVEPTKSSTRKGHFLGRVSVQVPPDFGPDEQAHTVEIYVAKLTTSI